MLLWGMCALALALWLAFTYVDRPLKTEAAPMGMLSFELAGERFIAQRIVEGWSPEARLRAAFGLGLDFLFIPCYSTCLVAGCVWASRPLGRRIELAAKVGGLLAWGQWIAALADTGENVCLLSVLLSGGQGGSPQAARLLSLMKFAIVAAGAALICAGIYQRVLDRLTRPRLLNRAVSR